MLPFVDLQHLVCGLILLEEKGGLYQGLSERDYRGFVRAGTITCLLYASSRLFLHCVEKVESKSTMWSLLS